MLTPGHSFSGSWIICHPRGSGDPEIMDSRIRGNDNFAGIMKSKTQYACQSCGQVTSKWLGRCPACQEWNTLVEEFAPKAKKDFYQLTSTEPRLLADIPMLDQPRYPVGMAELDRVLGGGLVPGSLVLIGGDPGIGKSTLILQTLQYLAKAGIKVLYVTGEESEVQIKMRGDRLGISSQIWVIAENSMDRIVEQAEKFKPQVLVVDSIQTVFLSELSSAPGSLAQVRECAGKLLYLSKTSGIATILIGHVTKEGSIAGPKTLEHMVDCVLYFEGDTGQHYRILRTIKNRYGSTHELGVFEMTASGLAEVLNPSFLFLPKHGPQVGSAVTASLEGNRPFLVEIQGLVSKTSLPNPRRTTVGVDSSRVALLVAVLEKIMEINLYAQDIYVNAAGGFKVMEPATDLAILGGLVSSFYNKPIISRSLLLGEVGLSGEIRGVQGLEPRLKEAQKMGFERCILPKSNEKIILPSGFEAIYVESVREALEVIL